VSEVISMSRKLSVVLAGAALVLSVFVAALTARETFRSHAAGVVAEERHSMFGGDPGANWCLFVQTNCQGAAACTLIGTQCVECRQNVPSYKTCVKSLDVDVSCDWTFMNPGSFCATTYLGTPVNGQCPACTTASSACGTQMPNTVTGTPCSP
jgi:hypothetical protein